MNRSAIAKLLATENINVVHGNHKTAFFDLENRSLNLPAWDNVGKELYDLLIGHEVGHALYTPLEGWHHSTVELSIPRNLVNIVEDVRIESLIQKRYPGLVPSFTRGYKDLYDRDFFGTEGRSIDSYNFIDRLNLKSKLRSLIEVPFSAGEQELYDMVQRVTTFDDVIAACQAIVEFVNTPKEEPSKDDQISNTQTTADSQQLGNDDENEPSDETPGSEKESGGSSAMDEKQSDETSEEASESKSSNSDPLDFDTDTPDPIDDQSSIDDQLQSQTDDAFRQREDEFTSEKAANSKYISEPPRDSVQDIIDDLRTVTDQIEAYKNEQIQSLQSHLNNADVDAWRETRIKNKIEDLQDSKELKKFLRDSKQAVNVMVKEFELRKSASRLARASESKKGTLNTSKLHTYKYNDNVFKRVINLADDKSHGLVMFIDLSGSMSDTIGDVVKQVIQLQMFCKAVKIPYEVYTFTTKYRVSTIPGPTGTVNLSDLSLIKVLDSSMSRIDTAKAIDTMYGLWVTRNYQRATAVEMGGTPLVATLICAHTIVPAFQKKHNVEMINTVILSDGEPTGISAHNVYTYGQSQGYVFRVANKDIAVNNLYVDAVIKLQESLQKHTNGNVINMFMADSNSSAMSYVARRTGFNSKAVSDTKYDLRKYGHSIHDDIGGANMTIVIRTDKISGSDDEFEVEDNISKQQMKKQFGKFMNSKKANRIIFTKFAQKVAEAC